MYENEIVETSSQCISASLRGDRRQQGHRGFESGVDGTKVVRDALSVGEHPLTMHRVDTARLWLVHTITPYSICTHNQTRPHQGVNEPLWVHPSSQRWDFPGPAEHGCLHWDGCSHHTGGQGLLTDVTALRFGKSCMIEHISLAV